MQNVASSTKEYRPHRGRFCVIAYLLQKTDLCYYKHKQNKENKNGQ